MMRLCAAGLIASFIVSPVQSLAGEIADAGRQAEVQAGRGQFLQALDALQAAQDAIWQASPLLLRKYFFVAAKPGSFGVYDLRENSVFHKNEQLLIYAEPIGFGYGRDGEMYTIDIAMDFDVRSKDGTLIARQMDFGSLQFRSNVQNREFFANITYNFSGLKPGDYEVITTLRDKPSGKTAEFTLPFTMTE